MKKRLIGVLALTALMAGVAFALVSCGGGQVELVPREVLFGNPEKARARLSPDGEHIAYVAPVDGVLNVWVGTLGEDDAQPVTHDDNRGIFQYFWAFDGVHLMYLQDRDGDENWLLYAVNLETGDTRVLTPYEGVQVRVVDVSKHHPNTILIAMNRQDPRFHDVYRLDLASGDMEICARNPGNILGWVTDFDMQVRGALAMNPEGGFDLLVRDSEEATWQHVLTWDSVDNMTSGPVGFTKDGTAMYLMDSRNANAGRLVRYDLGSGELEVIASDPTYDVSDVMVHPDTYEILAVAFTRAREEWEIIDQSIAPDFEAVAALDDGEFSVVSYTNDFDTWLVAFVKDDGPITYYIYDRGAKAGEFLFVHRPDLADYTLAGMEPVSYTARDGMTVNGYITFPPNANRRNLPMVLNVHGGPWHRDTWGYNPEAQWLANRGYVCLQVNFRGSTGYGKEFVNAGNMEWGGDMQNDLTDAVQWAVDQGYADPERIAIYGHSYGGYAALAGATFTPDLYTCAIAGMGPSNLITFIETVPPYWTTMLDMLYERVGHPVDDADFLKSRSPLFFVDNIEIPMLVAQGANDPRVKQAESEQIVAAMQEKGIEVEYILFDDEGHGFAKPENRLRFYGLAEQFLAEHLGGRYEPVVGGEKA
jgi:dipeptidyl aminopeptidase/acylaminoacyl peptidase